MSEKRGLSPIVADEFKVRRLTAGDDNAYLTDQADIVLAGKSGSRRWRDGTACANEAWRMAA